MTQVLLGLAVWGLIQSSQLENTYHEAVLEAASVHEVWCFQQTDMGVQMDWGIWLGRLGQRYRRMETPIMEYAWKAVTPNTPGVIANHSPKRLPQIPHAHYHFRAPPCILEHEGFAQRDANNSSSVTLYAL